MSESNQQLDAVKALEVLMHDGPGGTVVDPSLIPTLRLVRDEIERLRIENDTLAAANRWFQETSEREWDGRK